MKYRVPSTVSSNASSSLSSPIYWTLAAEEWYLELQFGHDQRIIRFPGKLLEADPSLEIYQRLHVCLEITFLVEVGWKDIRTCPAKSYRIR